VLDRRSSLACHEANITGFVNTLVAARDTGIACFIYAAFTYGNHPGLPKRGEVIGTPLLLRAVTA